MEPEAICELHLHRVPEKFVRRKYNASQAKTSRKKLGLPDTGHAFCGRACNLSYQRKKRLGQLEE